MVCQGFYYVNVNEVIHENLLLLKNATVNWNLNFDQVCKQKRVVTIAYINTQSIFMISNETLDMVRYEVSPAVDYAMMAWEWEMQAAFFETCNIQPIWINAYYWGWYDNVTDQWFGAVGMIQRDEVDYAIPGFLATYDIGKVAAFSPGIEYVPYYWLTRYPQELPPTWNLLGLFTKGCISQFSFLN